MNNKMKNKRVNRRTFIQTVAEKSGKDEAEIEEIYDCMEETAKEIVSSGHELFLIGFGSFFLARHKGHPVRYGADNAEFDDYIVFKFSPSNVFVKALREKDKNEHISV